MQTTGENSITLTRLAGGFHSFLSTAIDQNFSLRPSRFCLHSLFPSEPVANDQQKPIPSLINTLLTPSSSSSTTTTTTITTTMPFKNKESTVGTLSTSSSSNDNNDVDQKKKPKFLPMMKVEMNGNTTGKLMKKRLLLLASPPPAEEEPESSVTTTTSMDWMKLELKRSPIGCSTFLLSNNAAAALVSSPTTNAVDFHRETSPSTPFPEKAFADCWPEVVPSSSTSELKTSIEATAWGKHVTLNSQQTSLLASDEEFLDPVEEVHMCHPKSKSSFDNGNNNMFLPFDLCY